MRSVPSRVLDGACTVETCGIGDSVERLKSGEVRLVVLVLGSDGDDERWIVNETRSEFALGLP